MRRRIIKTSLTSGREIEKSEKGQENTGHKAVEQKNKESFNKHPNIISIGNEVGKLSLSQDVYRGRKRAETGAGFPELFIMTVVTQ